MFLDSVPHPEKSVTPNIEDVLKLWSDPPRNLKATAKKYNITYNGSITLPELRLSIIENLSNFILFNHFLHGKYKVYEDVVDRKMRFRGLKKGWKFDCYADRVVITDAFYGTGVLCVQSEDTSMYADILRPTNTRFFVDMEEGIMLKRGVDKCFYQGIECTREELAQIRRQTLFE